jgi:DMSO/TMAO reductase YedYZ heme-binding membrane subunit
VRRWLLLLSIDNMLSCRYHRWLGRWAVLLALAHFIAYFIDGSIPDFSHQLYENVRDA